MHAQELTSHQINELRTQLRAQQELLAEREKTLLAASQAREKTLLAEAQVRELELAKENVALERDKAIYMLKANALNRRQTPVPKSLAIASTSQSSAPEAGLRGRGVPQSVIRTPSRDRSTPTAQRSRPRTELSTQLRPIVPRSSGRSSG